MSASSDPLRVLAQPTIWLSTLRSSARGRACRDYVVYDGAGAPVLVAQTSAWQRDIVVHTATQPPRRFLLLRRRLSFPLTGRVDVRDEHDARLGTVSRSGRYRDVRERIAGRFRDARSFGNRAREGVLVGVLDALVGADGTVSEISRPSGFVWLTGSSVAGTLGTAPLPFLDDAATASATNVAATTSRVGKWSKRLRAILDPPRPQGWKLERLLPAPPGDPRLVLAAALFTIELSHW